jgi:hypothetical protein
MTWNLDPPPGFQGLHPDKPVTMYRRHLPHLRQAGATYFVTFRLGDSLPREMLDELSSLRADWERRHPPPRSDQQLDELCRMRATTGSSAMRSISGGRFSTLVGIQKKQGSRKRIAQRGFGHRGWNSGGSLSERERRGTRGSSHVERATEDRISSCPNCPDRLKTCPTSYTDDGDND